MENPWQGLAAPANGAPTGGSTSSEWDGYATPVETPKPAVSDENLPWYHKADNFVVHQTGMLANSAVKGATAIPTLLGNLPIAGANLVTWADRMLGGNAPSIPYVNPFGGGADIIFGPNGQPQNNAERMETAIEQPLFSVGANVQAGREALQQGSKLLSPKIAAFMAGKPALQMQAAAGGGASGEGARELGFGPKMQMAASLLGGLATPAAFNVARGVGGLISPLTEGGQNKIVNNIVASYAKDPKAAAQTLGQAKEYIPGFNPTGGTTSGDTGLIGLERTLQQQPQSPFTDRYLSQNALLNDTFQKLGGSPADIAAAERARDAATTPGYQAAAVEPISPDSLQTTLSNIDQQVARVGPTSDAGRTLLALKAKIQGAIPEQAQSAPPSAPPPTLNQQLGMQGPPPAPAAPIAPAQAPLSHLQQIYREERDQAAKTAMQPGAYGSTVKSSVKPAIAQFGQDLETASPTFAATQQQYRDMSKPITQMENMQETTRNLTGGTQDANANYFVSPAKIGNLLKEGQIKTDYNGWQPLSDALSSQQYEGLQNANKELQRANLVNTPVAVRPGSPTFLNAASSNALSSLTGGRLEAQIPFVKNFYLSADKQIKDKLMQAIINRELTLRALKAGVPAPTDPLFQSVMKNTGLAAAMSQYGHAVNASQNQ